MVLGYTPMHTNEHPPKVVLLYENALMRRVVVDLLQEKPCCQLLAHVADAPALKRALAVSTPDLLLLCAESALAAERALLNWCCTHAPAVRTIVLGGTTDEYTLLQLFCMGVRGYCSTQRALDELPQVLAMVRSGGTYFPEEVWKRLAASVPALDPVYTALLREPLEEKYKEFLRHLAAPDEPTYEVMAERMGLSVGCMHKYRQWLCEHFRIKGKPGLLKLALDLGLRG